MSWETDGVGVLLCEAAGKLNKQPCLFVTKRSRRDESGKNMNDAFTDRCYENQADFVCTHGNDVDYWSLTTRNNDLAPEKRIRVCFMKTKHATAFE